MNGDLKFFEVKRNAAEDKQSVPETLRNRLKRLESELPFSFTPRLVNRDYDCADLEDQVHQIKFHVVCFEEWQRDGIVSAQETPAPFGGEFTLVFHLKSDIAIGTDAEYFSPVSAPELSKYLLGPGGPARDGTLMVPMVQQAVQKGADYLVCRVTAWEVWPEVVKECFGTHRYVNGATFFVADERLGAFDGVILFSRYDSFCIVNNMNAEHRNWLVA